MYIHVCMYLHMRMHIHSYTMTYFISTTCNTVNQYFKTTKSYYDIKMSKFTLNALKYSAHFASTNDEHVFLAETAYISLPKEWRIKFGSHKKLFQAIFSNWDNKLLLNSESLTEFVYWLPLSIKYAVTILNITFL